MKKEIENEISKKNLSFSDKETIDKMHDNNLANDDLNNYKEFVNEYNSCSFDCYLILFINGILQIISNSNLLKNNQYLYDSILHIDFDFYLNFIHFIKKD